MLFYMRQGVFETGAQLSWLEEQQVTPRVNRTLAGLNRGELASCMSSDLRPLCGIDGDARGLKQRHTFSKYIVPLTLFVVLLLQLWVRVNIIQSGYELEALRSNALKNDAYLRHKRLELAYLARPDVLRKRAAIELKMVPLAPQRVRWISRSTT